MADEFDFISWILGQQKSSQGVVIPIGDDLAALQWDPNDLLLVGVDQVLDGVHFDSSIHSPRQIGRKVMNRNLSDCAAMACWPVYAVATVALPKGCGMEYAKELYMGLKDAAAPYRCEIVGGDTGSWDGKLVVTVSILGKSAGIKPITRNGAHPGDTIYVTGPMGGSILGRHMNFSPRVELARELAKTGKVHAMIDMSDGLSRDLGHICRESNLGALIHAQRIPLHPDAIELSKRSGKPPLEHALHDGEDYELIVVGEESLPLSAIGQMQTGEGITLENAGVQTLLSTKAWEHSLG
jgi:thiamine-monophosphate kinase